MSRDIVKLSVYGILTNKDDRFLMQKRSNTSYASGWWSFPGGHVEPEEAIYSALERELLEEVGVGLNPDMCLCNLSLVRKPQSGKRYINFFYGIKGWVGEPFICDGKASELAFFHLTHLPEPTLPYIREALHLINRGIPFYESTY